jgi:hypothetical protein
MAMALLLAIASASVAQPSTSSSANCSQSDVARTAAVVDATRTRLLALPIGDGMQTDVSTAAQHAIAEMKDNLDRFIQAHLRCVGREPDAAAIKAHLSSEARAWEMSSGVHSLDELPADFGKYGFELSFDVRLFENPRLIGVTSEFSIECGRDTVLLLFAPDHESWHEVLRWQTEPYKTVAGGTTAFHYGVSPSDDAGRWFAVTHDVAPSCSSTWSVIRYAVLRPDAEPRHPHVVFSSSDSMWWGNEDFGSLTVEKDAFDLRFHSSSVDGGVHNRVWVRHYSVMGAGVRRTQPVAVSPRDFVDEWIVSPWTQAAQWSASSVLVRLRRLHAEWAGTSTQTRTLLGYGSVHRCSDRRDHYQVEVDALSGPTFDRSRSVFFHVLGDSDYTMLQISEKADARCQGPDLLDEMRTR